MKDAQKPDHVSLTTLISRLKEGRLVIPDFQREFEWLPWDIRDLNVLEGAIDLCWRQKIMLALGLRLNAARLIEHDWLYGSDAGCVAH